MDHKKINYCKITPLLAALLLFNLMIFTVGKGQNIRKIGIPALIVQAENFISNSGNIVQIEKKNKGGGIMTNTEEAWLSYKLNIPVTGRYNIRIYAANTGGKEASCWIEDYIDNKDGRTYNISGDMVVKGNRLSENNFIQKDAAPLAAGIHYIKLHIEKGAVIVDHLNFTMMKEHKASPVVFKQNTLGKEWQLEWSDEFDGTGLPDSSKWTFDIGNWGWGNNELQYYTNKRVQNARQENGNLIIEARKNDNGFPWSSARLTTRGKESFLYGKIEFRARVPVGRGTWSAGWLLGDEYTDEFSWPYCGEIDVLESVGFELNGVNGNGKTHASVHCGTYYFKLGNQKTAITDVENMSGDFHTYALEWFPDSMLISVDGKKYFNYHDTSDKSSWPFNKPQNLILNLAIGGGWGGAKGVDSTLTSQKLIFDYVRVYSRK
ncbi:MAG: family 16 glycosylhydrolase [Mariniphaga sp.]